MPNQPQNYINGEWRSAASGQTFQTTNPARPRDTIGTVPSSDPPDVDAVVDAATTALDAWDRYPAPQRGRILRTAGDLLAERKPDIARAMTREMDKPVFETKGDVQEATGTALVKHPGIDAVGFTGSYEVGISIAETCGRRDKRVSLEMGGKNPMIVLGDADLDLALEGAIWGACGATGQRCTATSRLICHEGVHNALVSRIETEAGALCLGDGTEDGTDIGPLINAAARRRVQEYVDLGVDEGALLQFGGQAAAPDGLDGYFFEPTLFTDVSTDMRIAQDGIFGPVLLVFKVASYDESVTVASDTRFGLSSAIYTTDANISQRALRDLVQLQLVRCAIELWTDLVRPYLKLELGAIANCFPQKIV